MSGNGLEAMKELVDAGCLGRKTGKGMYVYKKGSKDKPENADAMAILKKYASPDKIEGLTETEIQERISRYLRLPFARTALSEELIPLLLRVPLAAVTFALCSEAVS